MSTPILVEGITFYDKGDRNERKIDAAGYEGAYPGQSDHRTADGGVCRMCSFYRHGRRMEQGGRLGRRAKRAQRLHRRVEGQVQGEGRKRDRDETYSPAVLEKRGGGSPAPPPRHCDRRISHCLLDGRGVPRRVHVRRQSVLVVMILSQKLLVAHLDIQVLAGQAEASHSQPIRSRAEEQSYNRR
jgi:hypothetical protein